MIHKPPALNRDDNRDPNIEALKGGGLLITGLHYSLRGPRYGAGLAPLRAEGLVGPLTNILSIC